MSYNVTFVAQDYWYRAREISHHVRLLPELAQWATEDAMDLCTEIYHMPAPDWLQRHAKRFSENRSAILARHYEDNLVTSHA